MLTFINILLSYLLRFSFVYCYTYYWLFIFIRISLDCLSRIFLKVCQKQQGYVPKPSIKLPISHQAVFN